ncbi:MAG: 50S ribosomal protein P1 [Desulfurococcales archaeon]|nr:50S ribosomal protein P1 [Desulfurococcales archaeon]
MEYIYAALILHQANKEITEENIKKILEAAGIAVDEVKVKALVAGIESVDIDEVIKNATAAPVAAVPAAAAAPAAEEAKEEKPAEEEEEEEEEELTEEDLAAGLGALFG